MRDYTIEHDQKIGDYRMIVIRRIADAEVSTVLGRVFGDNRCGYVSVPKGHPLHGKGYDFRVKAETSKLRVHSNTNPLGTFLEIFDVKDKPGTISIGYLAEVHGGITYAASGKKNYPVDGEAWWFGFDAAHFNDTFDGGRSLEYMVLECHALREFLQSYENYAEALDEKTASD